MDRVLGLRLGADDYRRQAVFGTGTGGPVISVLRRYTRTKGPEPILKFGDLTIDTTSREVLMAGKTRGDDAQGVQPAGLPCYVAPAGVQP